MVGDSLAGARRRARPFTQGLDSLCGAYSIVNAVACCVGNGALKYSDYEHIFGSAISSLERQGALLFALTNGMTTRTLLRTLHEVAKDLERWPMRLEIRRPFAKGAIVSKQLFAKYIEEHLRDGAAAAIFRYSGPYEHWSVTRGTTDDGLLLFDSLGMTRLPWRSLTVSHRQRDKYRYYVHPRATIFLRLV